MHANILISDRDVEGDVVDLAQHIRRCMGHDPHALGRMPYECHHGIPKKQVSVLGPKDNLQIKPGSSASFYGSNGQSRKVTRRWIPQLGAVAAIVVLSAKSESE